MPNIPTIDRDWLHDHMGTAYQEAGTPFRKWMLVTVEESGLLHMRTQDGQMWKVPTAEFERRLRTGALMEINTTWG